jgi:DNA-binding transcriptional LysR family regulator
MAPAADWRFTEGGKSVLRHLQPRMRTTTNDSAIAAAVAGLGLTRLLSYQAAEALRLGSLQVVLEAFEPPPMPVHVVHREGRRATQKVRGFVDLAVSSLRAEPALR